MYRSLSITVILASYLLAAACDDTKACRSAEPISREVTIALLDLPMGVTSRHGEAPLIIGSDGSIGLLDIVNSNHDDQLRDVIRFVNQERLTSERGFETGGALQVEWMLLTHYHGDHIGAFDDLPIDTDETLTGVRAVAHRGFVGLGDGMNEGDFEALCEGLRGSDGPPFVALCRTEEEAPCQAQDRSHPFRATSCPGLFAGDLFDSDDNSDHEVAFIPLGGTRSTANDRRSQHLRCRGRRRGASNGALRSRRQQPGERQGHRRSVLVRQISVSTRRSSIPMGR